jgi:hypothetical protein
MHREMTAPPRAHGSTSGALLTVVGLGTAALAGAALALAVNGPSRSGSRRRPGARHRAVPVLQASYSRDAEGFGLFI